MHEEKECPCRCHTWSMICSVDANTKCCAHAGRKQKKWQERIDLAEKKRIMRLLHAQASLIQNYGTLIEWVENMSVPPHLKKAFQQEIALLNFHYAKIADEVEKLKAIEYRDWILRVCEKYL